MESVWDFEGYFGFRILCFFLILCDFLGYFGISMEYFGFLCFFFVISKPQIDNFNSGIPASLLWVNIIELSILETLFNTFFGVEKMSPKQMQKHFKLSRKHSRVLLFDLFGAYSLRQTKIQNISRYWVSGGIRCPSFLKVPSPWGPRTVHPFDGTQIQAAACTIDRAMAILNLEGDDEPNGINRTCNSGVRRLENLPLPMPFPCPRYLLYPVLILYY